MSACVRISSALFRTVLGTVQDRLNEATLLLLQCSCLALQSMHGSSHWEVEPQCVRW